MYSEKSIQEFLDDLSSSNSIPGGGSAAALSGALNAAVISFIANLTIDKEKYKEVEAEAKEILAESEELKKEMLLMIDQDSRILSDILDSYKAGDKNKVKTVCQDAVEFSMDMTKKAVRLMRLSLEISEIGNRMLASDFEVAAYIGDAAVSSAIANVKINLKSLDNQEYKENIKNEYLKLKKESSRLKAEIIELAN
ncbi:cyclodeaminase/cyclohydrolase family protein [Halanaerobium congolense]|jgi:formiminotetrahydrofolate cyclodeaminase|uniref:Formimidoyltetrahydrofolate cyclodeaminase n=2 Tax=Halanaerobium TaxID=2330 RepID=A0A1G6KYX1_9FIRM|nr:cyclodeaminase/cyclohydrolase family protein [Halanaerobium congolense]PUU89190.1 MAG: Methenyl tetrahydrofolate cyclohydrolase [Halanaerobium sp.]PTX15413.1 formimidoyltetrahydrofolate cyclodeaminase [Halanaerobium congolense]PXV68225.1 formimidoyltetrahydrofolate cyclodeaminase [Halanaerobium congolense]TDP15575.1 formimidoyltetrahydrofolate cyclodeaminase [Halanaerobium congolense]TDS35421.1 formimidoyltetrahydrofolate cyclodeaminase [Halanaerobium congolense]